MRGSVDTNKLLYHTDIEDIEIMQKIIQENIEASKKTSMPLI